MSYTRWSISNWYSFYNSGSEGSLKEDQILSLWHTQQHDFTYQELLSIGKKKLKSLYPEASDEDIDEALDIIEWFKEDVELEFPQDDIDE